jgi:hypothetical protein
MTRITLRILIVNGRPAMKRHALPTSQTFDLEEVPLALRKAFLVLNAEVTGLRAQTERRDYLMAELRHALYGRRSEQLAPDDRQLTFEDLETAVAEAETAREALTYSQCLWHPQGDLRRVATLVICQTICRPSNRSSRRFAPDMPADAAMVACCRPLPRPG